MKRVMAIANQKGGVGKTTTAVNLAASLAATRRRTLLIDLDPQGNATMGCGIDKAQLQRGTCEVLLGEADIQSALVPVEGAGFTILPTNQDLVAAEVRLLTMTVGRETKLQNALKPVREDELVGAVNRALAAKGLSLLPEEELHRNIGTAIRDLRKKRALTLKQLAKRTGLSVSLLSQIERAESSASVTSLYKIAHALKIRLPELFARV